MGLDGVLIAPAAGARQARWDSDRVARRSSSDRAAVAGAGTVGSSWKDARPAAARSSCARRDRRLAVAAARGKPSTCARSRRCTRDLRTLDNQVQLWKKKQFEL